MHKFLFALGNAVLLNVLIVAPAFAAPATAWEDTVFSGSWLTSIGHHGTSGGDSNGMVKGGEDMFGDWPSGNRSSANPSPLYYGVAGNYQTVHSPVHIYTPYRPNYVAPPAPPPAPPIIYIERN